MPIYVYRCSHCGHQQDVLQKMSDPLLRTCPACGRDTYEKQVTAAGFRLKGTGWYETDFRHGPGHSDGVAGAGKTPADGDTRPAAASGTPDKAASTPTKAASGSSASPG